MKNHFAFVYVYVINVSTRPHLLRYHYH